MTPIHSARPGTFLETLPYLMQLANRGVKEAIASSREIALGVNTYKGRCVYKAVADSQGIGYTDLASLL